SDKDVVFDAHAIPDLHTALDGDAVADHDIVFKKSVIADVAILSHESARQNMGKRPDPGAGTNSLTFHKCLLVYQSAVRALQKHVFNLLSLLKLGTSISAPYQATWRAAKHTLSRPDCAQTRTKMSAPA